MMKAVVVVVLVVAMLARDLIMGVVATEETRLGIGGLKKC